MPHFLCGYGNNTLMVDTKCNLSDASNMERILQIMVWKQQQQLFNPTNDQCFLLTMNMTLSLQRAVVLLVYFTRPKAPLHCAVLCCLKWKLTVMNETWWNFQSSIQNSGHRSHYETYLLLASLKILQPTHVYRTAKQKVAWNDSYCLPTRFI